MGIGDRPRIHLVNPMWQVAGSERRTYELYRLLAPHADVTVWSPGPPHPHWVERLAIEPIDPSRRRFPHGGTVVFVGVYYRYGRWIHLSGCQRRIIVYNSPHHHILRRRVRKLRSFGTHPVEVVFASRWLQQASGFEGAVQISPVDLKWFTPRAGPRPPGAFTVGRLSRNQPEKHNRRDPELYRRLVSEGMDVRVMGGLCLPELAPVDPRVQLLPEGAEEAVSFLQRLDCLLYRTDDAWWEPHGRVVQEAMACGLPVVCGRAGGMSEYIEHGRNGFVFDSEDEALATIKKLRDDPELHAQIGRAARASMEQLFSPGSMLQVRNYYLRGADAGVESERPSGWWGVIRGRLG